VCVNDVGVTPPHRRRDARGDVDRVTRGKPSMAMYLDTVPHLPPFDLSPVICSMYHNLVPPFHQPFAYLLHMGLDTTCMRRIAWSDLQNLHPYTSRSSSSISHVPSPSPASSFTLPLKSDTCVSNSEYAA